MHAQVFGSLLLIKSPVPLFRIWCIYYYTPGFYPGVLLNAWGIVYSVGNGVHCQFMR